MTKDTQLPHLPIDGVNLNRMTDSEILNLIDQKADFCDEIAEIIMEKPELLKVIFTNVSSKIARAKFRSIKILKIISMKQPQLLMPHWNFFIKLLESDNSIILWNVLDVIANLTSVDEEHKFDEIFQRYYQFLEDDSMVTAAHVVDNSSIIAINRPDLQEKITDKLLLVDEKSRDGECQEILAGKAILAFDKYFDPTKNKDKIISFAKKHTTSQRNATKAKAEKFLKKHKDK